MISPSRVPNYSVTINQLTKLLQMATSSREESLEAAINRFRDCGVEIERFSLREHADQIATSLCIDGVPRFTWKLTCKMEDGPETV